MNEKHKSNSILFTQKGIEGLVRELSQPFKQISVIYPNKSTLIEKDRWITPITLWNENNTGLRISVCMNDVAERVEVGSLCFERVTKPDKQDEFFKLQDSFSNGTLLQKVILNESGKRIETGIIISAANGAQIFIVPNAMPYTLAMRCTDILLTHFEPEYPLEEYLFEDWKNNTANFVRSRP